METTQIIAMAEDADSACLAGSFALLIMAGHDIGRVVRVPREGLSIGRSSECGLSIGDRGDGTSRRHVQLRLSGERLWIRDLGSKNGFLHNREHVTGGERLLLENDKLRIGGTLLKVVQDNREVEFFEKMYLQAAEAAKNAALQRQASLQF